MKRKRVKLQRLNRQFYYKLEVLYNKYAPAFVAGMITLDNHFDLQNNFIHSFTYLCVPSILTLLHMYISRSVLKFCRLHRILVNYVFLNVTYRVWQSIPYLPQFDMSYWHGIYTITFLIGLISFTYNYVTGYKRTPD